MTQEKSAWSEGFDLLATSPDCVVVITANDDFPLMCLNQAVCDLLELPRAQVTGAFLRYVAEEDLPKTAMALSRAKLAEKADRFTCRMVNGRSVEWSVSPFSDHQLLLVGRDITDELKKQEKLYRLAHFDTVTSLPNRHLFSDRGSHGLATAQREERQAAIVFLDLDNFKPVNDTHGHAVGDEVLREVGRRLVDGVRDTDTVTRLGGDEFVVFLSMIRTGSDIELLTSRLMERLALPIVTSVGPVEVEVSHGVAVFPNDGPDLDTLLNVADHRMYEHKRSKKE